MTTTASGIKKVTMNLTARDIENTEVVAVATHARSKAQAVSTALSLTRFVIDNLRIPGTSLVLRTQGESDQRIAMHELDHLSPLAELDAAIG